MYRQLINSLPISIEFNWISLSFMNKNQMLFVSLAKTQQRLDRFEYTRNTIIQEWLKNRKMIKIKSYYDAKAFICTTASQISRGHLVSNKIKY